MLLERHLEPAIVCAQIKKMSPEESLRQLWLRNAIGSCVSHDRLRHATVMVSRLTQMNV